MDRVQNQTDLAAKEVFSLLVRDFRCFNGHAFREKSVVLLKHDLQKFRELVWPTLGVVDPYVFKIQWQLQNLLKRHRFQDDVYSDDDLELKSQKGFISTQERLAKLGEPRAFVMPVLREARRICRRILGKLDDKKLTQHCRIGKRSTLGSPLASAYIDCKLGDPSQFTCPTDLRSWFFLEYLKDDPRLGSIVRHLFRIAKQNGDVLPLSVDFLNLVNVPKSWKSFRGITPLSNIGLFYSYGLKVCFEDALRAEGLDIRHLQKRHGKLARKYSRSKYHVSGSSARHGHVTVDLSEASNSIMSVLLCRVLPRAWYRALRRTFIRQMKINGKSYYCESVLPMGNASTFPVETLVFYCLIKAVGNLLNVPGTYSVYGDDLIYPVRIHRHVSAVFAQLGLLVNAEKSFGSLSLFRESCGSDYYNGIAVRPALLSERDDSLNHVKLSYQAWLYKTYNALCERWHHSEIPNTLRYLLGELAYVSGKVYQVPPSYPAYCGIKTAVPRKPDVVPYVFPKFGYNKCSGSCQVRFSHLSLNKHNRIVYSEDAYLWEWFKTRDRSVLPPLFNDGRLMKWFLKPIIRRYISFDSLVAYAGLSELPEPSLYHTWQWERKRMKSRKHKNAGFVRVRYVPSEDVYCTVKDVVSFTDGVSSIPNWA